jgi:hypothetical protein
MGEKKRALQLFRRQLQELDRITPQTASAWRSLTTTIIKTYLGPDSEFKDYFSGSYNLLGANQYFREDIPKAKEILNSCILLVEQQGVYKNANSNFISRMSEGWATAILFAGVPLLFGGGYFLGDYFAKNRIEQQHIELKNEVERLKAERSILVKRLADKPAKPKINAPVKKNNN